MAATSNFITCGLNLNLYVSNPKCTRRFIALYKGFYIKSYEGKNGTKKYYLCAQGSEIYNPAAFTAPLNALLHFHYATGSHSKTCHSFTQWFVVKQNVKATLDFENGGYTSQVEAINLQPLPQPDDKAVAEAEAEILNLGFIPSQYHPVRSLYYYAKQLKLINNLSINNIAVEAGQTITIPFAQPQVDEISALKAEIEKKRRELEELERLLNSLLLKQGSEVS